VPAVQRAKDLGPGLPSLMAMADGLVPGGTEAAVSAAWVTEALSLGQVAPHSGLRVECLRGGGQHRPLVGVGGPQAPRQTPKTWWQRPCGRLARAPGPSIAAFLRFLKGSRARFQGAARPLRDGAGGGM